MLEVKKPDASEIKYPVGRKSKFTGVIVIFWEEKCATVASPGETDDRAGLGHDGWPSCTDEDTWEPVDIHIYG
ncbi:MULTISPECIES: hypothetical protein [Snodgrassella]|uniref:hypothetical protein n=1 Tax=Snodgrassella TaxID=1193515 RepID=UPI0008159453|nr:MULTISPECIES: hypothetical protein [Snodgrassella]SCC08435.1 hypothetical protein GA0061082_10880 [Snodgrassella sp. R-53583]